MAARKQKQRIYIWDWLVLIVIAIGAAYRVYAKMALQQGDDIVIQSIISGIIFAVLSLLYLQSMQGLRTLYAYFKIAQWKTLYKLWQIEIKKRGSVLRALINLLKQESVWNRLFIFYLIFWVVKTYGTHFMFHQRGHFINLFVITYQYIILTSLLYVAFIKALISFFNKGHLKEIYLLWRVEVQKQGSVPLFVSLLVFGLCVVFVSSGLYKEDLLQISQAVKIISYYVAFLVGRRFLALHRAAGEVRAKKHYPLEYKALYNPVRSNKFMIWLQKTRLIRWYQRLQHKPSLYQMLFRNEGVITNKKRVLKVENTPIGLQHIALQSGDIGRFAPFFLFFILLLGYAIGIQVMIITCAVYPENDYQSCKSYVMEQRK